MVDRTRTLRYFVRCNEQISLIANNSAVVTAEFTEINISSAVTIVKHAGSLQLLALQLALFLLRE